MSDPKVSSNPLPWSPIDALVLWALLIIGAVVLFLGWWGASATTSLSNQVAWLNVAALGLLVAGIGNVIWLTAGRRAVGTRRRLLLADAPVAEDAPRAGPKAVSDLVAATNMTRYHRSDCPFAAEKAVRAAGVDVHRQAGRRPCGVCLANEVNEGGRS